MTEIKPVRIDKYLWAVRIFKTRSLASDACRMGRILINNTQVKPSGTVEGNEILTVRKPPVIWTYRIIKPIGNRISAKLLDDFITDLTPDSEKIKLKLQHTVTSAHRKKGIGRPTKKERRTIEKWTDGFNEF